MAKLKSCPHCGADAVMINGKETTSIICTRCSAICHDKNPLIAVTRWNTWVSTDDDINFQKAIDLLTQTRDLLSEYVIELKARIKHLESSLAAAKGERHE